MESNGLDLSTGDRVQLRARVVEMDDDERYPCAYCNPDGAVAERGITHADVWLQLGHDPDGSVATGHLGRIPACRMCLDGVEVLD